ncbi:peptidylprolyl isomerase [Rheinheimera sp. F8]|uniref:FKBP-type peptidyl-prolyl cis-trans isomerase n=1 Tax=Rheinheimera sp. F8 TaxID=1763998 RepID=UPI000744866C|nr:peptidylprolyl isomerase [Rheinheimera sp. F8]ALZ75158.1 peptidylprolyl isomerase [Rheinheimera sp. F8]ALZ76417.1 peptidylprolyl isomerase [Rheinheimera sp. F8]
MIITQDSVVQLHYRVSEAQDLIEDSANGEPMLYLHGHQNMLPAIEQALAGKAAGDELTLVVAPKDAYGERDENAIQSVQVKHLKGAKKWAPGMTAVIETEHGPRQVKIVKMGMFKAEVDVNHPLAGKTLTFELKVVSVRAASAEEVAHGHAHGVGGHHHH